MNDSSTYIDSDSDTSSCRSFPQQQRKVDEESDFKTFLENIGLPKHFLDVVKKSRLDVITLTNRFIKFLKWTYKTKNNQKLQVKQIQEWIESILEFDFGLLSKYKVHLETDLKFTPSTMLNTIYNIKDAFKWYCVFSAVRINTSVHIINFEAVVNICCRLLRQENKQIKASSGKT